MVGQRSPSLLTPDGDCQHPSLWFCELSRSTGHSVLSHLTPTTNLWDAYYSPLFIVEEIRFYQVDLVFRGGSVNKEFACNTGDLGSVPGLGRSPGGGNGNPLQYSFLENGTDRGAWWATVHRGHQESDTTEHTFTFTLTWSFPGKVVKNTPANTRNLKDIGLIPGLGRFPEGGCGNPLQYSCLENAMDRGAWWTAVHGVVKSWTGLKQLSTYRSWLEWLLLAHVSSSLVCLCNSPILLLRPPSLTQNTVLQS